VGLVSRTKPETVIEVDGTGDGEGDGDGGGDGALGDEPPQPIANSRRKEGKGRRYVMSRNDSARWFVQVARVALLWM